jgi:hypothetical protein
MSLMTTVKANGVTLGVEHFGEAAAPPTEADTGRVEHGRAHVVLR